MPGDICESCGLEGFHPECERGQREAQRELEETCVRLAREMALHGTYGIASAESQASLSRAESRLREDFGGSLPDYDQGKLIEGDGWWYFPITWVGGVGYLVEARSDAVYVLGSGLRSLEPRRDYPSPWLEIRLFLEGKLRPETQR